MNRIVLIVIPLALAAAETGAASEAKSPVRRVLEAPERALDAVAWPLRKGVEWAERVDLPERVTDALYFDDARTSGWLPNVSFGGEIDSGVGFKVFHNDALGAGEEVELSTLFSVVDVEEWDVRFRWLDPEVGDRGFGLLAEISDVQDSDQEFFVERLADGSIRTGADASEDDEIELRLHELRARLAVAWRVWESLEAGIAFAPVFGSTEEDGQVIPPGLAGFGDDVVLLGGGPFLEWDTRDSRNRPKSGWLARVDGGLWGDAGSGSRDTFRYVRYRADLRRYQPTFRHDRSLVFRAFLDRVETVDGTVPFWELPALDEETYLRGFERNRFRDRGALLLNVEYRYPVWDTWDAFLFLDEGQVFDEYRSISIGRFEWSAGAGVQFLTASGFLFQIRTARSDDGQRFRIDLNRPF